MGKSKYPNKLDTSLEIPAVRDNIVEVGSDVLNSLRSAIFNIERTLGINPQGATGNSVASRINTSLDGNGNILKEALDKAGLLSGPITNSDVSKAAGIDESKLRLEYPTTLLQDEISQIMLQIKTITDTLEELAYLFAAHTHLESKNRHKAQAITVDKIENNSSNLGITSAEQQTSQELFEALFSSHINYDGSDISLSNRSHKANQVHFDNENVSAYVDSNDVQGAIEDVLRETSGQLERHQNLQHSNGRLRSSAMLGSEEEDLGVLLVGESDVSFYKYSSEESSRLTTINFEDPPDAPPIQKSDIVRIYNGTDGTTADYQIYSTTYSALNKLESIQVFGMINRNSTALDKVKIFANANAEANPAGLLISARPFPDATNLDVLQVANPDASAIITRKIRPSEISISNRYITIVIDETKEISVDLFNGTVPGGQTVDTIVKALNESFTDSAANALAYRVDYDDNHSSEVAIVHTLPSTSSNSFTLSVKRGTDDAIYSMGLGYIEDQVIDEGFGAEFYIQGEGYSGLGKKFEQAGLSLTAGTSNVTSYSAGIDFTEYGITDGDLLVITNTPKDDGTYVIENVSPSSLTVDEDQLPGGAWISTASDNSVFYIYKNSVSLKGYNFLVKYGTSNSAIFDVFIDKNREVFYDVRLEHGIVTLGTSESIIAPCDFTGDVSLYTVGSPANLKASLNLDGKIELSLDNGPIVEMASLKTSYVTLKSGLYDISLRVYIEDSDYISSKITTDLAGEPIEMSMVGYEGVNKEENLMLARVQYDSGKSRISGAGGLVPRIFKTLQSGVTSDKDLSTSALNKVYQGPIRETRSNGVTKGLLLTPADTPIDDSKYVVNIAGGTCFVKGRRFSYPGYTDLISDIDSTLYDKVFIAINEWGEIVFAGADSSGGAGACICPFNADSFCILSCLEFDNTTVDAIDLRLFIDNLDLKVLNSITVSPQRGMGHFTEFGEAIKYAKRFSDMFPKAGVPTVHLKSGTHKVVVDTGVTQALYTGAAHDQAASYYGSWINFPVNITGEGYSTALDIMKVFSDAGEENDDRAEAGDPVHDGFLFIAGPGVDASAPNGNGGALDNGFVTISNLRFKDCSVIVWDPWIKDSDGNKLNWGVKIDSVIFDRTRKVDFDDSSSGVWLYGLDSDGSEQVGNLSISNCEFLNAPALISSSTWPASSHRNISFTNNTSRGTGDGTVDGQNNYLVRTAGAGSIFSFVSSPMENNIEFRGNTIADDETGGISTYVDYDNNHPWGDRISRHLTVGGHVGIGGNMHTNYPLYVAANAHPTNGAFIYGNSRFQDDLYVGGELELTGGLSLPGNLTITDSLATISLISTGSGVDTGSELNLTRSVNSISNGMHLGEIRFKGKEGGGNAHAGAAIFGTVATSSWSSTNTPANLDFWTDTGNSWDCRMRLTSDGALRVGGGSDVTLAGYTGTLLIGEDFDANNMGAGGQHMALDDNEIQVKTDGLTAGTLYLNPLGGLVCFGGQYNGQNGSSTPRLTILGNTLSSQYADSTIQIDSDVDLNGTLDLSGSLDVGGGLDVVGNLDVGGGLDVGGNADVDGSVYCDYLLSDAGTGSDSRAAFFKGNSGNAGDNSVYSVVHISDYQSDAHDGAALSIKLKNIDIADMDNADGAAGGAAMDGFISFQDEDGGIGSICGDSGSVVYNSFTGAHITPIDNEDIETLSATGLIVISNGKAMSTRSLSEPYVGTSLANKEKDKRVLGVISKIPRRYDKSFVLSGWKEGVYGIMVNSVGNGRIWVTNIAGNIENGDLICSSDIAGYGQLQDDDLMRNYTVAKATEAVDWDKVDSTITHDGVTYKRFLIACSYHCG